jgi:hypothetical protein
VGDALVVRPEFRAVLAHRVASSDCCGAKLDAVAADFGPAFTCRGCGEPCERVLSEPEEVTVHG